jgi:hypothetical protein
LRLPQVRELDPEPPQPQALIRPQKFGPGRLGEGEIVLGVPAANVLTLFALLQLFARELPDRLQHPVA